MFLENAVIKNIMSRNTETDYIIKAKQFILYHTLIKSTTEWHTAALTGPHSARKDNGIFSWFSQGWVMNDYSL